MELISIHEEILTEKLLKYLRTWNFEDRKIQILGKSTGDRSQRVATISFVVENLDVTDFISFLDKKQIGIKYANFYAKRLLMFLRDHRVKNLGWKDDRFDFNFSFLFQIISSFPSSFFFFLLELKQLELVLLTTIQKKKLIF